MIHMGDDARVPDLFRIVHEFLNFFNLPITNHNQTYPMTKESLTQSSCVKTSAASCLDIFDSLCLKVSYMEVKNAAY
jgi:hypothetical protein